MAELVAGRRWRLLCNVVDHLPRHSAYGEAVAQDDELAAQRDETASGVSFAPPLTEWSPQVELLAELVDVVSLIRSEVWALAGQKTTPKFRPMPRPQVAADRVESLQQQRRRQALVTQLFPDRGEED